MRLRDITSAPLAQGTRVLLRVDVNAVLKKGGDGRFDDFRMREMIPVIAFLLRKGCRVRILGHLGRPNGRRVPRLSLALFSKRFEALLGRQIIFVRDPFSKDAYTRFNDANIILFFENLRFWPGEEKNSPSYARGLARWGDLYVNEAFSDSHRDHASITGIPKFLPAYAGIQFCREVAMLSRVRKNPRRPLIMVLGGAKVSTKLPLIRYFLGRADRILVAGAMANTVYGLSGIEIGKSTAERMPSTPASPGLFQKSVFLYPEDVRVAPYRSISRGRITTKHIHSLSRGDFIGDIGPRSLARFIFEARRGRTVIWNGPLGYSDMKRFENGTRIFARALSHMHSFRVVGGGETAGLVHRLGLTKKFSHVSTGGGAMLEFLIGKRLPGIEAVKK